MKKKTLGLVLTAVLAATMLAGCTSETEPQGPASDTLAQPIITVVDDPVTDDPSGDDIVDGGDDVVGSGELGPIVFIKNENAPAGYVYNELSGELIDAAIENQRPIAVMVDNEITALDHYGINDADVVYECMNSTANGRITRLMCIVKDWGKITQFGSVRSARTVNMMLSAEWNAVLCHDGGPVYIQEYYAYPEVAHLNGVFSRVDNGKAREFTEYICTGDLDKHMTGSLKEYNDYYKGPHFSFVENRALECGAFKTSDATEIKDIILPFPHNKSELHYNAETARYEYAEYGRDHVDGETGEVLAFKNVILQGASYAEYDANGYLMYLIENKTNVGWYLTDGKAIPILWSKKGFADKTVYTDMDGNELVLNAGNTYIALVPDDVWGDLILK